MWSSFLSGDWPRASPSEQRGHDNTESASVDLNDRMLAMTMLSPRRLAVGAAGAALAFGTAHGSTSVAQAAPAAGTGSQATVSAQGGTAPACIKRGRNIPGDPWASATNQCGKTMRIKIIIKAGDDSGCKTLANGKAMVHYFLTGHYQKTVTC
ncbi:hypothetical protein ACFXBB_39615 [Streptomyces scopuliridis]|uniref:hypothetical protein n=1 Tax=Streptomyces scopuliridis TaxID=452529 RepID=UPI0036906AF0